MSWRPLDCVYTHPLLCFRILRRHIFKYVIHCVVVRVWHTRRPRAQNSEGWLKIQNSEGWLIWIRGSARVAYAAPARALVRVWHTWRPRALIRNRHAWTHARWHSVCHRQNLSLLDIKVYASGLAINSIFGSLPTAEMEIRLCHGATKFSAAAQYSVLEECWKINTPR